jgi:hypothetical protein
MTLKLKKIKNYEDVGKMSAIPTYMEFDADRTGCEKAGWYAARINSKGIEVLPAYAVNFGTKESTKAFEECMKACNVHNTYLGMSQKEISILYAQRRFSHNKIREDLPLI